MRNFTYLLLPVNKLGIWVMHKWSSTNSLIFTTELTCMSSIIASFVRMWWYCEFMTAAIILSVHLQFNSWHSVCPSPVIYLFASSYLFQFCSYHSICWMNSSSTAVIQSVNLQLSICPHLSDHPSSTAVTLSVHLQFKSFQDGTWLGSPLDL